MTRLSDQSLTKVEAALRQRIGFNPRSIGGESVRRAVRQRMVMGHFQSADHYVETLLTDKSEFDDLVEELVVPETWFFRDRQPFHCLQHFVTHHWQPEHFRDPLRVLSLPCSTGEEPYSIVMTLLDLGLLSSQFQVDGADVSRRALAKAREAAFSGFSFRGDEAAFPGLSEQLLDRQGDSYLVGSRLRGTVQFFEANLVAPDCLAGQSKYHVVFCRNVLIYLDTNARRTAMASLHRLLAPEGFLYVGHVEAQVAEEGAFRHFCREFPFAFSPISPEIPDAAAAPAVPPTPLVVPGRTERNRVCPAAKASNATRWKPANTTAVCRAEVALGANRQAASVAATKLRRRSTRTKPGRDVAVKPTPGKKESLARDVAGALLAARRAADSGRLEEATTLCEEVLSRNRTNADALCLAGLISNAKGDTTEAERYFQKALYLDPRHHEALVHMMLLAQQRGDSKAAANFRRRVDQASEVGG